MLMNHVIYFRHLQLLFTENKWKSNYKSKNSTGTTAKYARKKNLNIGTLYWDKQEIKYPNIITVMGHINDTVIPTEASLFILKSVFMSHLYLHAIHIYFYFGKKGENSRQIQPSVHRCNMSEHCRLWGV